MYVFSNHNGITSWHFSKKHDCLSRSDRVAPFEARRRQSEGDRKRERKRTVPGAIAILMGSVGILIPNKKEFIASYGLKAVLAASLANLLSASFAGILFGL